MLERYIDWQGNLERLVATAGQVFDDFDLSDDGEITVRMVRDYIQRGILGDVDRAGRELEFTYEHLLKLVLSRVLLRDGWSLRKIAEHFDFSDLEELEDLFPNSDNPALNTIRRLRSSVEEPSAMRMSMSGAILALQDRSMWDRSTTTSGLTNSAMRTERILKEDSIRHAKILVGFCGLLEHCKEVC